MNKPYSELSFSVDLIEEEFGLKNPIEIVDKIEEVFNMSFTIHQVADYLDINRQDYELESKKQYYLINY